MSNSISKRLATAYRCSQPDVERRLGPGFLPAAGGVGTKPFAFGAFTAWLALMTQHSPIMSIMSGLMVSVLQPRIGYLILLLLLHVAMEV
jgi:hypothetical protein